MYNPNRVTGSLRLAVWVLSGLFAALLFFGSGGNAEAESVWVTNPVNNDWDTAANWSSNTVPGRLDAAFFEQSAQTQISIASANAVLSVIFRDDASAYEIDVQPDGDLDIGGATAPGEGGVINDSSFTQNLFARSSSAGGFSFIQIFGDAGQKTSFTAEPEKTAGGGSGIVFFLGEGNADAATLVSEGSGIAGAEGGFVGFYDTAKAGTAAIFSQSGTRAGAGGGLVQLLIESSADQSVVTCEGAVANGASGGVLSFVDESDAGSATLIAEGGRKGGGGGAIQFHNSSKGATARVEALGNGSLDISDVFSSPLTVGSIEGDGLAKLGSNTLSIGSNNLSTTFSGVIQDAGSVVKLGTGALALSGANTYSGGTTVTAGTLLVSNRSGSGTGSGALNVNSGTLGGSGTIAGAVTAGTGSGAEAFVAPAAGANKPATLTIQSSLTFAANSTYTYTFQVKAKKAQTDKVIAKGVTIKSGASFNLSGVVPAKLKRGTLLTVISNTAATPIAGTFANLPNGAILTVGANNLRASYQGGDGNDLTLTVQ